jgi:hypothetical protein
MRVLYLILTVDQVRHMKGLALVSNDVCTHIILYIDISVVIVEVKLLINTTVHMCFMAKLTGSVCIISIFYPQ